MNRKQLNNFKETVNNLFEKMTHAEFMDQVRAKAEERKARQAESDALNVQVNQEMARLRGLGSSPDNSNIPELIRNPNANNTTGPVTFDPSDKYALRAAALQNLQQNKEFVARANKIGQVVGKYEGEGSGGRFTYRHETQAQADAKRASDVAKLYDTEGNPRLPDFENAKFNPKTGEREVPMIGKAGAPVKTASAQTTNDLANAQDSPNSDIAAARAMEAEKRGDSGSGSVTNPNGTIDDAGRYSAIQARTQAANQERQASQAQTSRFGVGRGSSGQPIITGGSYKNPNEFSLEKAAAERENPESPYFDYQANQAKIDQARAEEQKIRDQARATIPASEKAVRDARLRLDQMRGRFGRPTPAGRERFSSNPQDRPGGYSRGQ